MSAWHSAKIILYGTSIQNIMQL